MAAKFLSSSKFKVVIDKAALLDQITSGKNGKVTGREVRSSILPIIEKSQKKLIRDFYQHSVTQEIEAGPSAKNSSGTLGGYGNLFSFIGFEEGSDPLSEIKRVLETKLVVRVRAAGRGKFKIYILNALDKKGMLEATPMPWAKGSSWADGIEKGISNLGSFLYYSGGNSRSRSGAGIQTKNNLRASSLKTQPYISKMIEDFLENVVKF